MVDLINPRTKKVEKRVKAQTIWDSIVTQAWKTADPGLIFLDEMNERNTVPHLGEIEATNPCGEQPLMPYESCNLGSINLSKFVIDNSIDFKGLEETIRLAVRFLDDIVDANKFPVDKIKAMTRTTRKIGLGYMGFADMLAALGIPYNSKDALDVAERLMKYLNDISHDESSKLALERGNFPGWEGSYWQKQGIPMRNSTTTTIAPTGTISIIANCSSSIEPFFALAFVRHVLDGQELMETNPFLEAELRRRNLYSEDLIRKIAEKGNLSEIDLPEDLKKIFPTAMEIDPEWHVMMQATFQRYCDSGVSKTINLPADASVSDVERAYRMARDLHCKGITVYRDRSKNEQVLYAGLSSEKKEEKKRDPVPELILTSPDMVKLDSTFDPACLTGKCSA
jgi:ribonucleoside-diphosphate reductase alpha chain